MKSCLTPLGGAALISCWMQRWCLHSVPKQPQATTEQAPATTTGRRAVTAVTAATALRTTGECDPVARRCVALRSYKQQCMRFSPLTSVCGLLCDLGVMRCVAQEQQALSLAFLTHARWPHFPSLPLPSFPSGCPPATVTTPTCFPHSPHPPPPISQSSPRCGLRLLHLPRLLPTV